MFKFLLAFISINIQLISCQSDSLTINTLSGPVRGKRYEFKSKFNQYSINAFVGIPYAKPPVGDNRFRVYMSASNLSQFNTF